MRIEKNSVIAFDYVLKEVGNEEIIDQSATHGQPLTVLIGAGQIIPGLESRMVGMNDGEKKSIEVPATEAYGPVLDDAFKKVPRSQMPADELFVGMKLQAQSPDGSVAHIIVTDFNDEEVTVDFNHPLAGKDLIFDVEIKSVRVASEEELNHGHVHGEGGHHH